MGQPGDPNGGGSIVGRDAELGEIAAMLGRIGPGGDGLLLLGEAGIGKSTLADATEAAARARGFAVARGWCSAADMPPYWPWRKILRATGATPLDRAAGGGTPDRDAVRWMLASVVDALEDAARRRPLVVILEDLHWADDGSLQLLTAVADALAAAPIGLVVTCRDEPGGPGPHPAAAMPARLRRLELAGLAAPAAAALAERSAATTLPADYLSTLWRRTRGHPLFIREVVRLDVARGRRPGLQVVPAGVRDVLERRLARLSQECWRALAAASLVGTSVDPALLSAVLDLPPDELARLMDEASAARFVEGSAGRPRFVHALVREVLADALPGPERRRLHRRIAEELQSTDGANPARVAHHWSEADGPGATDRAAAWWLRAARDVRAAMGGEQAVEYANRALALPGTDRVLALNELGEARRQAGAVAQARAAHRTAATLAARQGRTTDLTLAALGFTGGTGGFEVQVGDTAGRELLEQAAAALGPADSSLLALVRARLTLVGATVDAPDERIAAARRAVAMAHRVGDADAEAATLAAYCDAIAGPDHQQERERQARRMIALTAGRADPTLALLGRRLLIVALCERGGFAEVRSAIDAYRDTLAGTLAPALGWLPDVWAGMLALLAGDVPAALRTAAEVDRLARLAHSENAALMAFTLRMHAHQTGGEPAEMIPEVRATIERFAPGLLATTYLAAPAWLSLSGGDPAPARAVLDRFLAERPEDRPKDSEWLEGHWALAEIALGLQNRDAATRLHEILRPYRGRWAIDGMAGATFGVVAHQLGRLGAFLGDPEAPAELRAALAAYRSVGAHRLAAQCERELAAAADTPPEPAVDRRNPRSGRLRQAGRLWQVTWQGRTTTVADGKGVRDLTHLLRRPGQPVPAVELVRAAGGPRAEQVGGDLGPVLDSAARQAYRDRLADLAQDIATAEADHDEGRLRRLRAEREFLVAELSRATGLHGRVRTARDPAERARTAVTMRIRAAIAAIEREDPVLGRHLRHAVHTGRVCVYEPDDEVTWQI